MVSRNFLGNNFLFGWTPTGRSETMIYGDLVVFWPVLDLGHLEKFRAWAKNRKTQFSGARSTFGENIRPPQKYLPEIAQLFYTVCFGRPEPQGKENRKILGF